MSKADFYRELIPDVENLVIAGETLDSAIMLLTLAEDGIDGAVLKHWVCKQHASEERLEEWAEHRRQSAQSSVARFAELQAIIEVTPINELTGALFPQLSDWHRWIRQNAWADPIEKAEALAFAKNEIWRKRAAATVHSRNSAV